MCRVPQMLRMGLGHVLHNASLAALALALVTPAWAFSSPTSKKPLRIFFVDVEGGQATLFVTPDQHALLIDTGDIEDPKQIPLARTIMGLLPGDESGKLPLRAQCQLN